MGSVPIILNGGKYTVLVEGGVVSSTVAKEFFVGAAR
jgi:hypothetical protein